MPDPTQFTGQDASGEWLVTIFPAVDDQPATAEAAFRPNEWQTWGAPVLLSAVTP